MNRVCPYCHTHTERYIEPISDELKKIICVECDTLICILDKTGKEISQTEFNKLAKEFNS